MSGFKPIAEHEACHCVAAFLLGRKIVDVSIRRDADSDGRSHIQTLKQPLCLEDALTDIAIFTVADIHSHWRSMASGWVEHGVAEQDEGQAFECAAKLPGVDFREWRPIVELGRARAHVLLERPDFGACFEALVPALLEQKTMSGAAVEELFAATLKASSIGGSSEGHFAAEAPAITGAAAAPSVPAVAGTAPSPAR